MERRGFLKATAAVMILPRMGMAQGVSVNVREMGAAGDGSAKDTVAVQAAIDRCSVLGGGEVVVPAGRYLIGGIALRSRVTLRFEEDAVLAGSPDFNDYIVGQVRWEGKWIPGYLGLIHARDAEQIAIVGPGKILGAHELGGRPTKEKPLRHPCLIEPINCKGVRFEGFSTDYYRMWSIHPTLSDDITITGLTIRSTGGNGDGIDIDSCRRVAITKCDISTGDDSISIKSGRGAEGFTEARPSEDVRISDCTFADSIFACIGIGSETSGGIRNVRIERCKFVGAKTFAVYIKTRPGRGAYIEDIVVDDIDVSGMEGGFLRFNLLGSGLQDEVPVGGAVGIPTTKNFRFTRIRVKDVPVLVQGDSVHPDKPLDGFVLEDVTGTCRKGISLANVKGAKLKGIKVTGFEGPLLSVANVTGSGLEGAVKVDPPKPGDPIPVTAYKLR